ncbi:helix-turn-helix domain-containing protein [Leptothrix sp. BB-4]
MSEVRQDAAVQRWSTEDVAAPQRLDYWIGAVCENFVEMDVTCPQPQWLAAELATAPLGRLQLNQGRGSALDFYRTRRGIGRREDRAGHVYYLLCKTDSAWVAAQHGVQARLLPGDLVMVDSRHCYELHFPERCDTLSLELPADWVERWLPAPAEQAGRRIDGSSGFGAALSAYTRLLRPELTLAPPLPVDLLGDQLGALLALATGGSASAPGRSSVDLRGRIVAALRERHAEPGLTAAQVAAGLGVGERSLHRALAVEGLTFASLLAECRVGAARVLLADARFDRLTVAEIGRRVGLADASHFVRVIRRHTGRTPGEWRRQR